MMEWDVEVNGDKVLSGTMNLPAIEPQKTESVSLGFDESDITEAAGVYSLTDSDVYLNVRYMLRRQDGLLPAGSQVAYDQMCINEAALPVFENESGLPEYHQDGNRIVFSGTMEYEGAAGSRVAPWAVTFDARKGALTSYELAGKQLMEFPLVPCFARASTENDYGAGQQMRTAQWRNAVLSPAEFDMVATDSCYVVTVSYKPIGEAAKVSMRYEIYADGTIVGVESMADAGKLSEAKIMQRFGMEFAMPGEFSNIEFFGLGPHENYCDRYSSALMDEYRQRVEDQYHYGYARPQESGTKTQIKWFRVLDDSGRGLEIKSDVKFSASALPFHWKEMDVDHIGTRQAHSLELKAKAFENERSLGRTCVNFDLKQMGLGCVNSWGAWPREEHLVLPAEYSFRFILTPVNN